MKCLTNVRIILPDRILDDHAIVFDETIHAIIPNSQLPADAQLLDGQGHYAAPGLVDLHIHGYLGQDVCDADPEGLRTIAAGIAKNGVTAWCPTTMTIAKEDILRTFDAVRTVKAENAPGARILGIHCEGPFISPAKKGAQAASHILQPDSEFLLENADILKLVTVAPEMDPDFACIRTLADDGRILVSMGHSNADFETASAAAQAGVRHTTHLFNAMSTLNHRQPGVAGAALAAPEVSCELIADCFHVHPGMFSLVAALKRGKLCLITDCMRAGGMPDGTYTLGGQTVIKKGVACLLEDGVIAGSVLTLNKAVKNLYDNTSLTLPQAFACASLSPAAAIGEAHRIGSLEVGKQADLFLCDEDLHVHKTFIAGAEV